jgi:hypothetical protein
VIVEDVNQRWCKGIERSNLDGRAIVLSYFVPGVVEQNLVVGVSIRLERKLQCNLPPEDLRRFYCDVLSFSMSFVTISTIPYL